MAKKGDKKERGSIVIRKEEVVEGGHHGGAWKVAYADFVTAMMAFFLLMWLLNATTEQQRKGIADYFAPSNVMGQSTSGSGAPFGGKTPLDDGSMVSDRGAKAVKPGKATALVAPDDAEADMSDQLVAPRLLDADGDPASAQLAEPGNAGAAEKPAPEAKSAAVGADSPEAKPPAAQKLTERQADKEKRDQERQALADAQARERVAFQDAAEQIREAVRADPSLGDLAKQLAIDITPQGLRIQLMDEDKQPMFAIGSAAPNERARLLLQKIAPVLNKLSEPIAITGHTDATPYRGSGGSNWQLSSDRADATRRLLGEGGMTDTRFKVISGTADRDLLLPGDPLAAVNRRIAIVVLRTVKPPPPPGSAPPVNLPAVVPAAPAPPLPQVVQPRGRAVEAIAQPVRPVPRPAAMPPVASPAGEPSRDRSSVR